MKRKILAMLMALAMIISMVPMAAMAAEDHVCEGGGWQSNGDVTHSSYCKTCNEVVDTASCQSFNGQTCFICKGSMTAEPEEPACAHKGMKSYLYKDAEAHEVYCYECKELVDASAAHEFNAMDICTYCNAIKPYIPEEPVCDHEGGAWISNGDGTHTSSCDCGENTVSGECQNLGSGKCYMCGYEFPVEEPECDHEGGAWTSNGDGTHTSSCECGETTVSGECYDLGSGKCYMCGYEFPVEEPECEHKNTKYAPIADKPGYHDLVCADCDYVNGFTFMKCETTDENYDGICDKCGYQYKVIEPECDHEGGAWTSNGDGTHTSSCECGEYVDGPYACQEINGKCYMCGYVFHQCTMDELVSISETQHQFKCTCGEFVGAAMNHNDANGDNDCDGCGYTMYVQPECDHEGGAWTSNGDGTHTSSCECGLNVTEGPCYDLGKGVCYMCGYEFHQCTMDELVSISETQHQFKCECGEFVGVAMNHNDANGDNDCDGCGYTMYVQPECDHEGGAWTSNGDGTHTSSCECGLNVTEGPCYDLGKGVCYMCGYEFPVEEPECKHEWKGVVNNGVAGIHTIVCRDCLEVLGVESHKFVDNRPCACGAIYVEDEEPAECEHEWKGVVNNGEAGIHTIVCRDCLEELGTESHKFVDNRPCACGAIYVHDHDYEAGVTSNEDGTHKINCSCGVFVTVNCLDNDGDGKCDSCGYQKYSSHECDFEAGVTSNEDGTHNVNCSCGEFVTVDCLDNDGDGKCDSCGYQKYEPECKHDYEYVSYTSETIKYVCKHCGDVDIQSNAYYKLWQWCYDRGILLRDNWWEGAEPWLNWFK